MSKLQRMAIAGAKALIERAKARLDQRQNSSIDDDAASDLDKAIGWLANVLGSSKDSDS